MCFGRVFDWVDGGGDLPFVINAQSIAPAVNRAEF